MKNHYKNSRRWVIFCTLEWALCCLMNAQGVCLITPNTRITVLPHTRITFQGGITNHGIYQSHGTEVFSGTSDQEIIGNFSGQSSLGNVIKKNNGTLKCFGNITCSTFTWESDQSVHVADSTYFLISSHANGSLIDHDSNSRFFVLGNNASLKRSIGQVAKYFFPIGSHPNESSYRGVAIDVQSLGDTMPHPVSVQLISDCAGTLNYQKHFPSTDTACVAGSWVAFNCLDQEGWRCTGPSNYEHVISVYQSNVTCGGPLRRALQGAPGSSWQDSIESVVGDFASNLCQYSDWQGNTHWITGGKYRNFSDIAIASSTSVLPVTLLALRADPWNQKSIRISWKTASEINNEKFIVTRSTDGNNFSRVGHVAGSGTTSATHDYFFDDHDVLSNVRYYYQLEQVDYDGKTQWSDIVFAKINKEEILEIKRYNLLGQEILENSAGLQIIQSRTSKGVTTIKTFKTLP